MDKHKPKSKVWSEYNLNDNKIIWKHCEFKLYKNITKFQNHLRVCTKNPTKNAQIIAANELT
jgi:hypothetical protein